MDKLHLHIAPEADLFYLTTPSGAMLPGMVSCTLPAKLPHDYAASDWPVLTAQFYWHDIVLHTTDIRAAKDDILLPCPFCGASITTESSEIGEHYTIGCVECGHALVSVQIGDLLSDKEKRNCYMPDGSYKTTYIDRARQHAIELWNERV